MIGESRDLTKGKLSGQIMLFSLPLIASNLLQVLFNMSDVAVVGRFAGPTALGSVGSTSTLVNLFLGFAIGLGCGVNVLVAQYFGMRRDRALRATVHTAFPLCALIGVILALIGWVFARDILELLNTKPELIDGAELYFRIYMLGMPAVAIYNFGNAVFSAVGDTRHPLIYLSCAGVVNVGLNLFFVIVCEMSVAGVALASVISQYLSAGAITVALSRRRREVYGLSWREIRPDPDKAYKILRLGIPSGCQNAIFSVANLFIQSGVNSFETIMVDGNSAAANFDALVYDVMAAFYTACSSFMAQNFGAGKRERVKKSYLLCLAYSFAIGLVLGCLLVLFGPAFLSLFTKDAAVVDAGMKRLTIMGFSYAFSAFMDCSIAASRGLGKTLIPTVIVILGSCVFRVIWVYTVFAYFHTIPSLYLLYIFSWTITAIAEMLYFRRCYVKAMRGLPPTPDTPYV